MAYGFTTENIPEKQEFRALINQNRDKDILLSDSGNRSYLVLYKELAEQEISKVFDLVQEKLYIDKKSVCVWKERNKTVVLLQPLLDLPTIEELQTLYDDIMEITK